MVHHLFSPPVYTPSRSPVWRKIYSYDPLIFANIKWNIGNGASINVIHDPRLASTPLAWWPAPLNINLLRGLMIKDLSKEMESTTCFPAFFKELARKLLTVPLPGGDNIDRLAWCPSSSLTIKASDFSKPFLSKPNHNMTRCGY